MASYNDETDDCYSETCGSETEEFVIELYDVKGNVVSTEPNTRKVKKVAEEIPSVKKRGPSGSYYFYCMFVNL